MLQNSERIVHQFYQDENGPPDIEALAESLGYPPALVKACVDQFSYAAGLRNGTVILFAEASPVDEQWVTLELDLNADDDHGLPYDCPRGVDVRVSEIAWVADAPEGS